MVDAAGPGAGNGALAWTIGDADSSIRARTIRIGFPVIAHLLPATPPGAIAQAAFSNVVQAAYRSGMAMCCGAA
ncbi:hypothetical protein GCM10009102_05890 [Sphingomonas insulae]|uniref:Uncharacterized protein n=1 Tax=Sphingomonas insulae TaxID=424800 RepID=A0ABP3STR2_9SPHN